MGGAEQGRRLGVAVTAAVAVCMAAAPVAPAETIRDQDVYARVGLHEVVLGNALVERRWSRNRLRTLRLFDRRTGGRPWVARGRDFTLRTGSVEMSSERFRVAGADIETLPRGGLRVSMRLRGPGGLRATRVAEAYPRVAGFRTQTILEPQTPLVLAGATLDEVVLGPAVGTTLHAFRAGADWREPHWPGPPLSVGDSHPGTWRNTRTAPLGVPLEGPAQWLSAAAGQSSLFMVMERNDLPSSRAAYDGRVARLEVDYGRDAVVLGPFEEDAHAESPLPERSPGRVRVLPAGRPFALEAAFTGFGARAGDEPWQFHRYLTGHRLTPYRHDIVFNSNGVDEGRISTGAKDDMDMATVAEIAPIARALGVETFVLDDGWQARSGDWQPDSPQYPEPRGTPPRFPDPEFAAVRQAIAPMRLGLWMSPLHFNPASEAFRSHPEWVCQPVGSALAAANALQPDDGSNEAGIGQWSRAAIPHIEARIRDAIERWGVAYWKFDFLAWLDCAGEGDLYDLHDAFLAMVDRLRADHPEVTFQIDETNDYRLFPFESVARGPSWFQNGSPDVGRLLHNIWNLSPYVPAASLGQHVLGGRAWEHTPVDTLMAAALPSHITFFNDIRELPSAVVARAGEWTAFYRAYRDAFTQLVTPLLRDPFEGGWTALQSWNPDRGDGALLAFRQGAPDAVRRVPLKNVPPGRVFDLIAAPGGEPAGRVTSADLAAGLEVTIDDPQGTKVLVIRAR